MSGKIRNHYMQFCRKSLKARTNLTLAMKMFHSLVLLLVITVLASYLVPTTANDLIRAGEKLRLRAYCFEKCDKEVGWNNPDSWSFFG
ncbi:hypothetical protein HNY73_005307 [Argiope bruennichi]|uniref:Uncharacterized protein n=1 Tax=Argiope bruennichi TaxID=94029 RepID=A0A8T0FLI6_ARGBR|nr:hypothetical protein HNY73_005307 [Argiope bruennichi]